MREDLGDLHAAWAECLLQVVGVDVDGKASPVGNAFITMAGGGTGMAITAMHILDELGRLATQGSAFRGSYRETVNHPHFNSRLKKVLGARISHLSPVEFGPFTLPGPKDADLAAWLFQYPAEEPAPTRMGLKLLPPDIGTTVLACGWSGFKAEYESADAVVKASRIAATRTIIRGRVVRSLMRREGITPGPYFEIEGHFPSGLSGSPVVCDVDGMPYVCGFGFRVG